MSAPQCVERDERTVAVENAGYRCRPRENGLVGCFQPAVSVACSPARFVGSPCLLS